MHNLMIPNFQLHRAEPGRPPELLNLFDDCIPEVSILHRALSENKNPGYRPIQGRSIADMVNPFSVSSFISVLLDLP